MKLEDIKADMLLYYTERPCSDYADSLVLVEDRDGVLFAHNLCTNVHGRYINSEYRDGDIPIGFYYDAECWHELEYEFVRGEHTPVEYMTQNYPLDEEQGE